MRWSVVVALFVVLCRGGAADPVPSERLVAMLGEGDRDLRDAAEVALVQAPGEPDLAEMGKVAPGRILRVRRARELVVGIREAPKGSVERWMAIEEAFDPEMRGLSTAILTAAFGRFDQAVWAVRQRDVAQGVVAEFCARYETPTVVIEPGLKAGLEARLKEAGNAAVPHLLHLLAQRPVLVQYVGDFTLQQMRAMAGVALLGAKQAAPYLVLHTRQLSATAEGAAIQALARLLGTSWVPGPDVDGTRKAVAEWWAAHRAEFVAPLAWLGREVFVEAREDVALETVGVRGRNPPNMDFPAGWEDTDQRIQALGKLGGLELSVDPSLAPVERLQRIDSAEESWRARFGE